MDAEDVTAMVLAAAAEEMPKRPIDGVDLWELPSVAGQNSSTVMPGTSKIMSDNWARMLRVNGTDRVCERCEKTFRVHPAQAMRAFTCSHACAQEMYHRRKVGKPTPDRPLWPGGRWRNKNGPLHDHLRSAGGGAGDSPPDQAHHH